MKILLYNSHAEKNRANKDGYLDKIVELEGTLRSGTSLVNPEIVLELHDEQLAKIMDTGIPVVDDAGNEVIDDDSDAVTFSYVTKVLTANYAYIPDFNRYYFITDIVSAGRNLWQVTMSVDVLMSYYGEIMDLTALIDRNEYDYKPTLDDPLMPKNANTKIYNYTFDSRLFDSYANRNSAEASWQFMLTTVVNS